MAMTAMEAIKKDLIMEQLVTNWLTCNAAVVVVVVVVVVLSFSYHV